MLEGLRPRLLETEEDLTRRLGLIEALVTNLEGISQKLKAYLSNIQRRYPFPSDRDVENPAEQQHPPIEGGAAYSKKGRLAPQAPSQPLLSDYSGRPPFFSPAEPYVEIYNCITRMIQICYRFLQYFLQYMRESFWE